MADLVHEISEWFYISKPIVDNRIRFNGCFLEQDEEEGLAVSIEDCLEYISGLKIYRSHCKHSNEKARNVE